MISIVSFGYNMSSLPEADLVVDLRTLPNPHSSLKKLGLQNQFGDSPEVKAILDKSPLMQAAVNRVISDIGMILTREPERTHLKVAVGCGFGKHRSVYVANEVSRILGETGVAATVEHAEKGANG